MGTKEGGDVAREVERDEFAYVACLPCIFARMMDESHGESTTDPDYRLIIYSFIHSFIHPSTSKKKEKGGERWIEAERKKPDQFSTSKTLSAAVQVLVEIAKCEAAACKLFRVCMCCSSSLENAAHPLVDSFSTTNRFIDGILSGHLHQIHHL